MRELLDQIEARIEALTQPDDHPKRALFAVGDVARLLAAVRAVEQAMDDLDDARARGIVWTYGEIQYRVRNALTDALEGKGVK